jgi:hypothetical protein
VRPFCGHAVGHVSSLANKNPASAGLLQVGGTGIEPVTSGLSSRTYRVTARYDAPGFRMVEPKRRSCVT